MEMIIAGNRVWILQISPYILMVEDYIDLIIRHDGVLSIRSSFLVIKFFNR
jgi:hypothetical protein